MTFLAAVVVLALSVGATDRPSRLTTALAWFLLLSAVALVVWLRRRDRLAFQNQLAREAAARAVAEDRLEIARQLHDTISASLGAITVRCAVAQRLESDAPGLRQALVEVEQTSRQATDGLRQMLAVLREDGLPGTPPNGEDGPLPGRQAGPSLADLVERARAQGLHVQVEAQVPVPAVCLAVVAEALSNSARHAGPTTVTVTTRTGGGPGAPSGSGPGPGLVVAVVDTGPVPGWQPQVGASVGLLGLRERVEMAGGTLHAGARSDSQAGFEVRAWIPHPPSQSRAPASPRRRRKAPADD